ncbi:MAG: hypothetical protein V4507_01635, partial [Verrucomicrobiota bacterium]
MNMDPTSGKPKKNKPSYAEFDFDDSIAPETSPSKSNLTPAPQEEPTLPPPVSPKPFGKPISSHFESEPVKSSTVPIEPKAPSSGGTALGSFKAQSTVLPKKPITAAALKPTPPPQQPSPPASTPPPTETPMSSQIPSMS